MLAAVLLNRWLEPWLEARVRRIHNWPRMLRLLAVLLRRARWIVAALLLWIATAVMRELTWPDHSRLVTIVAALVTAWAAIAIVSRVIRNRTLANLVAFAGWLFVALTILGLSGPTARLLVKLLWKSGHFDCLRLRSSKA
jgi:hypothetical protein